MSDGRTESIVWLTCITSPTVTERAAAAGLSPVEDASHRTIERSVAMPSTLSASFTIRYEWRNAESCFAASSSDAEGEMKSGCGRSGRDANCESRILLSGRLLGVLKVRDLLEPLKGDADIDAMSDLEAMGATEPPLSVRTVWGDLEAGDVLRAKRAQKGVVQPDDVHEYLRAKAAAHTVGSTATVADAMRQLIRERLTFVVVVDPDDRAVRGVGLSLIHI